MKMLLDAGLLDGDCMTVTGKTIAENLKPTLPASSRPGDRPPVSTSRIKATGHIRIMRGNLCPRRRRRQDHRQGRPHLHRHGQLLRQRRRHARRASKQTARSSKGDVVIIRYEGPKGGPGMPEMLTPTSAIMGAGLGNDVALITDGRFSGGTTASSSATSPPRPRTAAPSRWCETATGSPSTPPTAPSTSRSTTSRRARSGWTPRPAKYTRVGVGVRHLGPLAGLAVAEGPVDRQRGVPLGVVHGGREVDLQRSSAAHGRGLDSDARPLVVGRATAAEVDPVDVAAAGDLDEVERSAHRWRLPTTSAEKFW